MGGGIGTGVGAGAAAVAGVDAGYTPDIHGAAGAGRALGPALWRGIAGASGDMRGIWRPSMTSDTPTPRRRSSSWRRSSRFSVSNSTIRCCCQCNASVICVYSTFMALMAFEACVGPISCSKSSSVRQSVRIHAPCLGERYEAESTTRVAHLDIFLGDEYLSWERPMASTGRTSEWQL